VPSFAKPSRPAGDNRPHAVATESVQPGTPAWEEAYFARRKEIAFRLGSFFVEQLPRLHRAFEGDLELPIILGEVAHHNVSRLRSLHGPLPAQSPEGPNVGTVEGLIPCNAFSLSQATGIPRETVRRKLDRLVRRGWLQRNDRGEVFVTSAASAHFTPDFNRTTLLAVLALTDDIKALMASAPSIEEPAASPPKDLPANA
jgi:hypothetical protein